jgi:hypothetical protein
MIHIIQYFTINIYGKLKSSRGEDNKNLGLKNVDYGVKHNEINMFNLEKENNQKDRKEFYLENSDLLSLPRRNKIVPILIKTRQPFSSRLTKRENTRGLNYRSSGHPRTHTVYKFHLLLKSLSHSLFPTLFPALLPTQNGTLSSHMNLFLTAPLKRSELLLWLLWSQVWASCPLFLGYTPGLRFH